MAKPPKEADSARACGAKHWILERIESFGDRPFMATESDGDCRSHTYTFDELSRKTTEYVARLNQLTIPTGSVVGLRADFGIEATASLLALIAHRCVAVPISDSLSQEQVNERLRESGAEWIWDLSKSDGRPEKLSVSGETHPLVGQITSGGESGLILFSSGSVGKPKAMVQNLERLLDTYRTRKTRKLRILSFLMFDHIGGLNTLFNSIATGAFLVVPKTREAEAIAKLIQDHSVHLLPTSPTFLNLLLMADAPKKFDLSSLKIITYGTEPMPTGLLSRLKDTFPSTRLLQTFGTSETGISQTTSKSSSSNFMRFDDPNLEFKIVAGELWLKSNTQIMGYLNHDNDRFTEDGWFKTGDQVEQSDDGFLRIVGRREELINVGGEKVTPSEVEGVLMQLPEVVDCLVYGQPNSITGQNVAADIVVDDSADKPTVKKLIRKHCRSVLQPYKFPSKIRFIARTEFSSRFKKKRNSDAATQSVKPDNEVQPPE